MPTCSATWPAPRQAIACLGQAGDTPARDRIELVLCLVRALSHAGQLPRARSWRQDAVRAALPLNDPVLQAARLWEQAIACLGQAGDTPARDRIELVLCLVRALSHAGQLPRARSWRQDAVRAALPLNDPVLQAARLSEPAISCLRPAAHT